MWLLVAVTILAVCLICPGLGRVSNQERSWRQPRLFQTHLHIAGTLLCHNSLIGYLYQLIDKQTLSRTQDWEQATIQKT